MESNVLLWKEAGNYYTDWYFEGLPEVRSLSTGSILNSQPSKRVSENIYVQGPPCVQNERPAHLHRYILENCRTAYGLNATAKLSTCLRGLPHSEGQDLMLPMVQVSSTSILQLR